MSEEDEYQTLLCIYFHEVYIVVYHYLQHECSIYVRFL